MGELSERLTRLEVKSEESTETVKVMNLKLDKVTARLDRMDLNGHTEGLKKMIEDWPKVEAIITAQGEKAQFWAGFHRYFDKPYKAFFSVVTLLSALAGLIWAASHF